MPHTPPHLLEFWSLSSHYPIFPPVIQIRVAIFSMFLLTHHTPSSNAVSSSLFILHQGPTHIQLTAQIHKAKSQNVLILVLDTFLLCYIPLPLKCFSFSHLPLDQYLISLLQFFRYTMLPLLIFHSVFQDRPFSDIYF